MGKVSNEKDLIVHQEKHLLFSKAINGFNIHFHTWYVNLLTVMLCTNLILAYITNQTRPWLFITGNNPFFINSFTHEQFATWLDSAEYVCLVQKSVCLTSLAFGVTAP